MEPQLFLFLRNFQVAAQDILNAKFRWFRLRLATGEEVSLSPKLRSQNWTAYCACDGSGIYNGAFGPLRVRFTRRKKGRSLAQNETFKELVIDGHEITLGQMQSLLNVLMDCSDDIVISLRREPINASDTTQIIELAHPFNIDADLPSQITVFTDSNQTVRLVRGSTADPSTNKTTH